MLLLRLPWRLLLRKRRRPLSPPLLGDGKMTMSMLLTLLVIDQKISRRPLLLPSRSLVILSTASLTSNRSRSLSLLVQDRQLSGVLQLTTKTWKKSAEPRLSQTSTKGVACVGESTAQQSSTK